MKTNTVDISLYIDFKICCYDAKHPEMSGNISYHQAMAHIIHLMSKDKNLAEAIYNGNQVVYDVKDSKTSELLSGYYVDVEDMAESMCRELKK